MFTSLFDPRDTLETLFHRIEECQEIAILGGSAYTVNQIMGNTMYLFLQAGVFLTQEFEACDAIMGKTWPALKTFVQQARGHKPTKHSRANGVYPKPECFSRV
jgi:hypothetical protein